MNAPVPSIPAHSRSEAQLAAASQAALSPLPAFFQAAVRLYDDALFERSERFPAQAQVLMDAMRELRLQREGMQQAFLAHLTSAWEQYMAGQPVSAERILAGNGATGGLSLMDDDDLESRLAVRNFATSLTRDCRSVLPCVERRLAWLAGCPSVESDHNPIGPEHLGVALHVALSRADVAGDVRLVLFKLSERELSPGLQKYYASLDGQLAATGVLSAACAMDTPSQRGAAFDPPSPSPLPVSPAEAVLPQWASRLTPSEAVSSAVGENAMTGVLMDALHALVAQNRVAAASGSSASSQEGGRHLSHDQMLSVLSHLQALPDSVLSMDASEDTLSLSSRLKREVLRSANRVGVDAQAARLGGADEDAIDLVGLLFDVILDERDLPGRSRELIGRLVVPFVKVALLDRRMFVQKTHPARRLLNALTEACEGNAGQTPAERQLMAKVEEVTERLLAEFNENLAIFHTLEEDFREFLLQHRRRTEIAERRAAETQRGQEKLEAARRRSADELALRDDDALPTAIKEFLGSAWRHHLTLVLLKEPEEDAPAVHEVLALGDALVQAIAKARAGDPSWIGFEIQLPQLTRLFASVGLYGDALAQSIDALRQTVRAVAERCPDEAPVLPELPPLQIPRTPDPTHLGLATPVDAGRVSGGDVQRFRDMGIGTWLDFVDREGKVQAGKLSWVSPISGRLLFVNRRGVRFCVASPEELAMMVQLGRLRTQENEGMFDAAMAGVIQRLDSSAAAPGTPLH